MPNTEATTQGIAFSDDGTRLAVGTVFDITIHSTDDWSVQAARDFKDLGGAPGLSLQFAEDDTLLVAAAHPFQGGSDVLILDAQNLETVTTIEQSHNGGVGMLDVSSDDSLIATVGADGFAKLWDFSTGLLLSEIAVDTDDRAANVQFVARDQQLMVTATHGLVTIVTIDNDAQLQVARSRLTRTFTDRECATYHIDPCPTLEEMTSG
jgi:hypothetical protein